MNLFMKFTVGLYLFISSVAIWSIGEKTLELLLKGNCKILCLVRLWTASR